MPLDDFRPLRGEELERCDACGEELDHLGACCVIGCPVYEASVGRMPGVVDAPVEPETAGKVVDLFDALKRALGGQR